jgi:hypothetical protein
MISRSIFRSFCKIIKTKNTQKRAIVELRKRLNDQQIKEIIKLVNAKKTLYKNCGDNLN